MKIITGALGFIGSNLFNFLRKKSSQKIILIDSNVSNKKLEDKGFLKETILDINQDKHAIDKLSKHKIDAVFHIGANADVNCEDEDLMIEQNYKSSVNWFNFSKKTNSDLIYASTSAIYGNTKNFKVNKSNEKPQNEYSKSKLMFDEYVRNELSNFKNIIYGFRFFNVFGNGEEHKMLNASIPKRFFDMLVEEGSIRVFNEEIKRDYVCVNSLCKILANYNNLGLDNGIYNLGSGNPISHTKIANIVIEEMNEHLNTSMDEKSIVFVPMPDKLKNRFQFFTKAEDLEPIIASETFNNEMSIRKYIASLCKIIQ